MAYYAQVKTGVCVAIIETARQPASGVFVEIPEYDEIYLGRPYADGAWGKKPPPEPDPQPTWTEVLNDITALRAKVQAIIARG